MSLLSKEENKEINYIEEMKPSIEISNKGDAKSYLRERQCKINEDAEETLNLLELFNKKKNEIKNQTNKKMSMEKRINILKYTLAKSLVKISKPKEENYLECFDGRSYIPIYKNYAVFVPVEYREEMYQKILDEIEVCLYDKIT